MRPVSSARKVIKRVVLAPPPFPLKAAILISMAAHFVGLAAFVSLPNSPDDLIAIDRSLRIVDIETIYASEIGSLRQRNAAISINSRTVGRATSPSGLSSRSVSLPHTVTNPSPSEAVPPTRSDNPHQSASSSPPVSTRPSPAAQPSYSTPEGKPSHQVPQSAPPTASYPSAKRPPESSHPPTPSSPISVPESSPKVNPTSGREGGPITSNTGSSGSPSDNRNPGSGNAGTIASGGTNGGAPPDGAVRRGHGTPGETRPVEEHEPSTSSRKIPDEPRREAPPRQNPVASSPRSEPPPAKPSIEDRQEPELLSASDVQPDYPLSAREEGITGNVVLAYLVNAEGQVENVKVARSSGDDRLDRAALAAARRWRYRPAVRNGQPQSMKWRRTLSFNLR